MPTFQQLRKSPRQPKKRRLNSPALQHCPQRKGVCLKTFIQSPRKPNSAQRKVCRVRLSTGRILTAFIPGEGHNLQEHSLVLVRGGRTKDLPGVRYKVVRGAYDLKGLPTRTRSRSKYGTKKP